MAQHDVKTSLRIVVSGLPRRAVRRHATGIDEEDDLGGFFRNAGCKVVEVRLVIDSKRRDKCRGFGFVDFEDSESFELALKLHNKEAVGLGKLHIERARAATDKGTQRQQQRLDARNQTKDMEQKLAFHAAKLNELVWELIQKQHFGGATQGSSTAAALSPAAFKPLACKEPAHKAKPKTQDEAESTASDLGNVAIKAGVSWAEQTEFWVKEALPLLGPGQQHQ